jgi:DNA-binding transcriptional MerR regulator
MQPSFEFFRRKLLVMQQETTNRTFQIPVKLYRIGDLIRYTPLSRQTIHNYTIMGLIRETQWTQGGHRLYDESVFNRLSRIIELKRTKTLWEIKQILSKEGAGSDSASLANQTDGTNRQTDVNCSQSESN